MKQHAFTQDKVIKQSLQYILQLKLTKWHKIIGKNYSERKTADYKSQVGCWSNKDCSNKVQMKPIRVADSITIYTIIPTKDFCWHLW